jgi:hypothetical protein
MSSEIAVPTERTCTRCGREERWDPSAEKWVVDREAGTPHCIHVWDITGQFSPVEG